MSSLIGFHLSDPSHDFDSPEIKELLRCIIAKQGVGLTGDELPCVFNSYLPAGNAKKIPAMLEKRGGN